MSVPAPGQQQAGGVPNQGKGAALVQAGIGLADVGQRAGSNLE